MILPTILNEMPEKTHVFFQPNQLDLAGSKQWHQKDILKLKPSTSMKIVSTINNFTILIRIQMSQSYN